MGFLNPGLVWFAMGASIPVIIHLLHRQRYRRVQWGAMQFLLKAIKRTQRRVRLEHLLLLLVRMIIMALLAFAIARPSLQAGILSESNTNYLFAIDNSYSMGFRKAGMTNLEQAKNKAKDLINKLNPSMEDTFTILMASEYPEDIRKEAKKDNAKEGIGEIKLSDYGSNNYRTFLKIKQLIDETKNENKKVYFFTDMQKNSWRQGTDEEKARFAQLMKELTTGDKYRDKVKIFLISIPDGEIRNAAIVNLRSAKPIITVKENAHFMIDIHNFSNEPFKDVDVKIWVREPDDNQDKPRDTKKVNLDPGKTTPVPIILNFTKPGAHFIRVELTPDFLEIDDKRFMAVDVRDAINIMLIDGEWHENRRRSELGLLKMCLDPNDNQSYGFRCDVKVGIDSVKADELEKYDCIVLGNVSDVSEELAKALHKYVSNGGGVFITLGAKIEVKEYNRVLYESAKILPARLTKIEGDAHTYKFHFSHIKMDHTIFAPFKHMPENPLLSQRLIFFQFFKMETEKFNEEETKVLMKFDDITNNPALVEKKIGSGKVMLYTSTWDDEWNNGWPGKLPYLPLSEEIIRHLAARPLKKININVGQTIEYSMPFSMKWTKNEYYLTHKQHSLKEESPTDRFIITPEPVGPDDMYLKLFYPPKPPEKPKSDKDKKEEDKSKQDSVPVTQGIKRAGIYDLTYPPDAGHGEAPISYFSVNLNIDMASPEKAESNLEKMTKEEFRAEFRGAEIEVVEDEKGKEKDITSQSHIWKYVLYLLLGFLLLESVMAWLFGRGKE